METRKCRYCNKLKALSEFETANVVNGKTYQRRKCRSCYQARKKARRDELSEWLNDIKKTLSCKRCGNNDYRVLDFHHRDEREKEFTIGDALKRLGPERILKEIAKCDPLCANCHRIVHWEKKNIKE